MKTSDIIDMSKEIGADFVSKLDTREHKVSTPPVNESWEKEFDKKFIDDEYETDGIKFPCIRSGMSSASVKEIKSFIESLLSTARQEGRDERERELCMNALNGTRPDYTSKALADKSKELLTSKGGKV